MTVLYSRKHMISLESKSSAKSLIVKTTIVVLLALGLPACWETKVDGYEPEPGPSYTLDENCEIWSEKVPEFGVIRIGVAGSCSSLSTEDYEFFLESILEDKWADWLSIKVLYVNSQEGSEDLEREVDRLANHQNWIPCIREKSVDQCFTEMARNENFLGSISGIVSAMAKKKPKVRFEGVVCRGVDVEGGGAGAETACRPVSFGVAVLQLD